MSKLLRAISNLTPEQRAVLERRLQKKHADAPRLPKIPKRHHSDPIPLSFAQLRLWFLYQLEPDNPFYNVSKAVRITGYLNVAALEQSLSEIVRRHEVLRTVFSEGDGQPVQSISLYRRMILTVVDLSELHKAEREKAVLQIAAHEAQRIFNLEKAPLLRGTLLKLSAEKHVVLFTIHHIASDAWSLSILIGEITQLYLVFPAGVPSPIPELPIQYADFACWQRQWLSGQVLENQLAYWKHQLADAPPVLELPTDRPRPAVQNYRGTHQTSILPKSLMKRLKTLSLEEGVTLYMTLLAAFVTLLYRYTGQDDIVIGSPIAGRNRAEIDKLIGFFINTLVIRIDLSGDLTFRQLLHRVREVCLGAYAHQDLSFEKLVEEMTPERNLSRSPLFQVMFQLQNAPRQTLQFSGMKLSPVEIEATTSLFDLSLYMVEREDLIVTFQYSTNLFDAATITRMLEQLNTLLESIVIHPEQRISSLTYLTEAQRHQLLVEWNRDQINFGRDICIDQLFETQVERTPDAVAVIFENKHLTYRDLNCRANQVAHYLKRLGVGPEVRVGICMKRSLEMVVGLLGILKASGVFVPLDPAYPKERIAFMLTDAQVNVLLTPQKLVDSLPDNRAQVVCLDTDWELIAQENGENPVSNTTPENLVYVIYTSGSTGKPKGAMITHRGLCNCLLWFQETYRFTEKDKIVQKTPLSFDVSVWEIFWALSAGASVVVARPDGHYDGTYLVELITEQEITVTQFVPSMLRVILEERHLEACQSLRQVISGGEVLPIEIQERFFTHLKTKLHNLYGPTETSIAVTVWDCEQKNNRRTVPIGRPITNTKIYLLDPNLQPVPIGVSGELYIGGMSLARGYHDRPDLTAERFIPDPFNEKPDARLYKTGDMGRYLPDGNIEFLGRIDRQVKIRGVRIELEEIESALLQHSAIEEAVVLVREDEPGKKHLVAYIVQSRGQQVTIRELRQFLRKKFPEYMMPSICVFLDALPLLPNGKVDRGTLPTPDALQSPLERTFVPPRTAVEKMLTNIWAEVLGMERVGISDNFFDLGGHSLQVTQLLHRVREVFKVDLPLRSLFETHTLAELAQAIEVVRRSGTYDPVPVTGLSTEAVLDTKICPETVPVECVTGPTHIFLTGATGFLGAFLLYELLQQTEADIYCLVRSTSMAEGQQRLQSTLTSYSIWHERLSSRIIAVPGDLSQPLLGLSAEQFEQLARKIEVIYHSGAWVNFVYPYAKLKAANVLGTQEVLRLASQIQPKPVHYISTLSVFPSVNDPEGQVVREQDHPKHYEGIYSGYAQSKWVAEKLVAIARSRGLPARTYRLGRITGHSQTGVCNTDDFLCRMIKGSIQLGSVPDLKDMMVDMTPVDYVSQAIVYLSMQKGKKVFHLFNPHPIQAHEIVNWVRSFGYPLRQIPYEKWRTELIDSIERSQQNVLSPLLPLFPEAVGPEQTSTQEMPTQVKRRQFDCQNTLDGLKGTSIVCPPTNTELLEVYFSYFIRTGFLDAPRPVSIPDGSLG